MSVLKGLVNGQSVYDPYVIIGWYDSILRNFCQFDGVFVFAASSYINSSLWSRNWDCQNYILYDCRLYDCIM